MKINKIIYEISTMWSEHISEEEGFIYPMLLNKITDDDDWKKIKEEFDKIGYQDLNLPKS